MKKIKFIISALAVILLPFVVSTNASGETASGKTSENKKEGSIVGTWTLYNTTGFNQGYEGIKSVLTFDENNNFHWETGLVKVKGTYKFANDTLTTTSPTTDGSTMDVQYLTHLENNELVMTLITDPKYQITFYFK